MENLINNFICSKCNGTLTFIKKTNTQTGLYCSKCGKWIKWLGKEEIRLYERKLEMDKIKSEVIMEVEEPEIEISLSQFSNEELIEEIRRRMRKGEIE